MRRLASLVALSLLGAAVGACVTPSIPIPPPDPAEMDFDVTPQGSGSGSVASFSYPANVNYKDSTYYVFDHNTGGGVFHLANPDGSIAGLSLPASLGDQVVVTIEGGDQTVSRCVVLRQGSQDPNTYCSF